MKLSRGDKPFIDYAKMDLQDATKQLLFCFSQEELDCRDYYRMEANLLNINNMHNFLNINLL